ncbi:hypothetical protein [Allobranchiibius huperziae]|uniref:Energy-coupling factor transporter ATP-binding protein EcfA2 n=1 Tax=Allobranchiibius huperziae TaxID=1874116 RepID=A0A853DN87_9MICO|nr:hypothetical protein [Allobranchiibius huperziae]NYJ76454.1 energy-coupling factor transporter ATP-binding protein EcfA2 [Allobranchiibius huperziae]
MTTNTEPTRSTDTEAPNPFVDNLSSSGEQQVSDLRAQGTRRGWRTAGATHGAQKAAQRKSGLFAGVRARRAANIAARPVAPGKRGWPGKGGGAAVIVDSPPEWRGSSVQVCGLWPFSAGSGTPVVGVPLGRHLLTRGTVCADPVTWFLKRLINNPSGFVLGRPGLGKSSLVRKMAAVLPAYGVLPIVLSDLRPDYSDLITALEGQVIKVGRGEENVNPLDVGPLAARIPDLPAQLAKKARADLEGRRLNVVRGLCELSGSELQPHEVNVLSTALRLVDPDLTGDAVIADLRTKIEERPPAIRAIVQDREENDSRYNVRVERLIDALLTLGADGPYGDTFARRTTTAMPLDCAVSFDMSAVEDDDQVLQAGLQLVCWSYGSACVNAAKYLADAGLAERRVYLLVMDELWLALNAAPFMVDRVNAITRLNRARMIGQLLITHTMDDLTLATEDATKKARGFVERSEMVFLGGLAEGEMGNLSKVFGMSRREREMITDWSMEGTVNPETGQAEAAPGQGNFLLKTGKKPGIPFHVALTPAELAIGNTNAAWQNLQETWSSRETTDVEDDA